MTQRRQWPMVGLGLALALLWAGAGSAALAQEAIVDTAIPFVAGATEDELMLRGPVGWPTYQTGTVDGLTYRFDPDGYARFGATARLDKEYWEIVCTPQPIDCTGRRGSVVLRVDAAGGLELEVEDANPEGRFTLDDKETPALTLAELAAPGHAAELFAATDLVPETSGEPVPVAGSGVVARYLRWVEHGQAVELRADATPPRPFARAPNSSPAAEPSSPAALAPAVPDAEATTDGAGAASALAAEPAGADANALELSSVVAEAPENATAIPSPSPSENDAVATASAAGNRDASANEAPKVSVPAVTGAGASAAGRDITALVGDEGPSSISAPAFAPTSSTADGLSAATAAAAVAAATKVGTAVAQSSGASSSGSLTQPPSKASPPAEVKPLAETAVETPSGTGGTCAPLPSSAMTTPVGSLRGLPGVLLFVGYLAEPPALKGRLQKDVLAAGIERFKAAGIRLLTESEIESTPGKPRLELYLTNGNPERGCEFRVFLSLRQEVALARDPTLHLITGTWGDGGLSRAGQADGAELATFIYYLDRFVADYQKANNEPPTKGKPTPTKLEATKASATVPAPAGATTTAGPKSAPAALANLAAPVAADMTTGKAPSAGASHDAGPAADEAQLVQPIQVALREAGYDPGPADGILGMRTRQAILSFQRSSGMDATGTANGAVLERLLALKPEGPRQ